MIHVRGIWTISECVVFFLNTLTQKGLAQLIQVDRTREIAHCLLKRCEREGGEIKDTDYSLNLSIVRQEVLERDKVCEVFQHKRLKELEG